MKRAALVTLGVLAACAPKPGAPPPRSTLVVGLDISGSFRKSGQFDDAMHYAALYIYGHINGLGGLKQATDVFVGSLGGEHVGQPKTFHPIQDLSGKTPDQIEADLRHWFPEDDPVTDFNAFFERTAVHIRRQNLVLAPLNIVLFSDGIPDFPGAGRMSAPVVCKNRRESDRVPLPERHDPAAVCAAAGGAELGETRPAQPGENLDAG